MSYQQMPYQQMPYQQMPYQQQPYDEWEEEPRASPAGAIIAVIVVIVIVIIVIIVVVAARRRQAGAQPSSPYVPPTTQPTQPTSPYVPPTTQPTQPTSPYVPPTTQPTQPTSPYVPPTTQPTSPYAPPATQPTSPYVPPTTQPAGLVYPNWGSGCGAGCSWVQSGTGDRRKLFDNVYQPDAIQYRNFVMPKTTWESSGRPGVWLRRADESTSDGNKARKIMDWINAGAGLGRYSEGQVLGYNETYPFAKSQGIVN